MVVVVVLLSLEAAAHVRSVTVREVGAVARRVLEGAFPREGVQAGVIGVEEVAEVAQTTPQASRAAEEAK